jgi:hypothetical protein
VRVRQKGAAGSALLVRVIVVVLVASVDRTAYPGFARVVSARELAEAFTSTEDEIEWARPQPA